MDPIQKAFSQLGTVVNTNSTRLAAMCKVLMEKGLVTQEEFDEAFNAMQAEFVAQMDKAKKDAAAPKLVRASGNVLNGNGRLHLGP